MIDMISHCSYEQNVDQLMQKTGFSKLQYAIMFRQFSIAEKMLNDSNLLESEFYDDRNLNLAECIRLNEGYIKNYEERTGTQIFSDYLTKYVELGKVKTKQVYTYSDDIGLNKNIFDVFFDGKYPLLDIEPLRVQQKAAEKVDKFGGCLVFDEVGTGKSVSSMYCISNVLNRLGNQSKILIVCPSPLRQKWREDLRRQLGVDSHVVNRGSGVQRYENGLKSVYFTEKEPCIFITGYKENELTKAFYRWDDEQPWDLVIVDEAHIGIKNYINTEAKAAVLLTATPIISYSTNQPFLWNFETDVNYGRTIITPKTYQDILLNMIEFEADDIRKEKLKLANSSPLKFNNDEAQNLFVMNFREQLFGENTKVDDIKDDNKEDDNSAVAFRNIKFKKSEMDWDNVGPLLKKLEEKIEYQMVRNHFSQDVEYLYHQIDDITFGKPKNYKKELLFDLISKSSKSYIVFCNHQFVVNLLYEKLYNIDGLIVAKKYGEMEDMKNGDFDKGSLLQQLHYQIVCGNRCVLITTGQTASVGLNLGLFDGVIHYELPYTSTELEQRFGRIDRMDVIRSTGNRKKDMIFLLDQESENPNFNHRSVNPMLSYCTIRIDEATKYLPIRNTILFHEKIYEFFKEEYLLTLDSLYSELLKTKEEVCNLLSVDKILITEIQETITLRIKDIKARIQEDHTISTEEDIKGLLENVDWITNQGLKIIVLELKELRLLSVKLNECAKKLVDLYGSIETFSKLYFDSVVKEEVILDVEDVERIYEEMDEVKDSEVLVKKNQSENTKKDNDNLLNEHLEENYKNYKSLLLNNEYKLHSTLANGLFYRDSNGIQSYLIPSKGD